MKNTEKPFGQLTREEKLELFNHWIEDGKIELYHIFYKQWLETKSPTWHSGAKYRKVQTKPSINWDHVNPEYKYLWKLRGGNWILTKGKPTQHHHNGKSFYALVFEEIPIYPTNFSSFKEGNCESIDSLVERPN